MDSKKSGSSFQQNYYKKMDTKKQFKFKYGKRWTPRNNLNMGKNYNNGNGNQLGNCCPTPQILLSWLDSLNSCHKGTHRYFVLGWIYLDWFGCIGSSIKYYTRIWLHSLQWSFQLLILQIHWYVELDIQKATVTTNPDCTTFHPACCYFYLLPLSEETKEKISQGVRRYTALVSVVTAETTNIDNGIVIISKTKDSHNDNVVQQKNIDNFNFKCQWHGSIHIYTVQKTLTQIPLRHVL